jgi:hypothetical protein
MPVTNPTTIKLTEADRARLEELCRLYGTPGFPLSIIGVIRRLIWQSHETEPHQPSIASSRKP